MIQIYPLENNDGLRKTFVTINPEDTVVELVISFDCDPETNFASQDEVVEILAKMRIERKIAIVNFGQRQFIYLNSLVDLINKNILEQKKNFSKKSIVVFESSLWFHPGLTLLDLLPIPNFDHIFEEFIPYDVYKNIRDISLSYGVNIVFSSSIPRDSNTVISKELLKSIFEAAKSDEGIYSRYFNQPAFVL